MRSVTSARDQLRAIAVEMFAETGLSQTSLRAIAKQAQVSPALLVHHFSSKEGLIEECITQTLGRWVLEESSVMGEAEANRVDNWRALMVKGKTQLRFFRQVMISGGTYAQRLFDAAVLESETLLEAMHTEGRLRDIGDRRVVAVLLATSGLGSAILLSHIENNLGGAIGSRDVAERLFEANNELMEKGIFVSLEDKKGEGRERERVQR